MKNNKINWIVLLLALVGLNILASIFHYRIDLTEEKRYSLTEPTKELLRGLQDPVHVEVFLEGEFPAGFRKLAVGVEEFLQEMKEYGGNNIQYSFTDPLGGLADSTAAYLIDSLAYFFDIPAFTLQAPGKVGDAQTQKLVLPGAVIRYRDTVVGVNLLKGEMGLGTEPEQLAALYNNIEASMEFKFANAIQKATTTIKPSVGYALGNGEGWGYNVDDMVRTLIDHYRFDTINISEVPYIPPVDALVIAKPTIPFTDEEKIKIDQYVMHGGKIFWMIDNMYAEFDSLYKSQGFIAFDRGLNLEDLLFNYGVRLNQSLLQDMQSDKLPQMSTGGSEQMRLVDWPFFPILNGTQHPVTKNLDGVRSMFPTYIDTVEAEGIKKSVLLESSANARLVEAPAMIDFEFLQIAPDVNLFRQSNVPVAYLLEGNFRSLYANRIPTGVRNNFAAYNYNILKQAAEPGKMIVVADGDIAMNQFSSSAGPLEMGTNVFTRYRFANKDFFTNALDYLVNPSDIIQARAKEFRLRLLDPRITEDEKTQWQLINIALPILLVIIFGWIYQMIRKKRFTL